MFDYILPYFEQSNYHIAFVARTWSIPNPWINNGPWVPLANIFSATLLCHSDPRFALTTHGAPVGPPMTRCNYFGFFSSTQDSHNWSQSFPAGQRAIFTTGDSPKLSMKIFSDGTSSTIAIGEYIRGKNILDAWGFFNSSQAGNQFLHITKQPKTFIPDNLISYSHKCSKGYNLPIQPFTINDGNGFGRNNFVSSSSYHTAGVNTAFVDGHIGFIPNSINI